MHQYFFNVYEVQTKLMFIVNKTIICRLGRNMNFVCMHSQFRLLFQWIREGLNSENLDC